MSRTVRSSVLAVLCLALTAFISMAAAPRTAPLIAVLPFDDGSIVDRWWGDGMDVGRGVADMIVTELMAQNKFRLAEREMINKILEEQDFGASGRVDAKSAAEIGKILGVRYVIIGKVTEFNVKTTKIGIGSTGVSTSTATVALDGRLVDTTTAEMLASASGRGTSKQSGFHFDTKKFGNISFGARDFQESILGKATRSAIAEFSKELTNRFFSGGTAGGLKITGKVAAVSGNRVWLNIGANSGVTVGMVFTIQRVVEEVTDPDTGEIIDTITEDVCQITISEVRGEASSIGTISSGSGTPAKGDLAVQK